MFKRRYIQLLALLVVALCTLSLSLGAKPKKGAGRVAWEERARQRQGDYLFLEALRLHQGDGSLEATLRHMEHAAALNPEDDDIRTEMVLYQLVMQADSTMTQEGLESLRKNFYAHPERLFWSKLYVARMRRMGNLPEVVRAERILDSIFADNTDITLTYADDLAAMYQYGDTTAPQQALAILNRLETGFDKVPWLVSRKVRVHSVMADTTAALNEVATMIDRFPNGVDHNLLAAQLYEFYSRPDSALYFYNRACDIDPTNGMAYYARAEFYKEQGDSVAYDAQVFEALQRENLDLDTKQQLLTNYVRMLYSDTTAVVRNRIINLFDILQEQHPHEAELHSLYGTYLSIIERPVAASEQFQMALDSEPSNEQYRNALISSLSQAQMYSQALQAIDQAIELYPQQGWYYLMKAVALDEQGHLDQAIQQIEYAVDSIPMPAEGRSSMLATAGDFFSKAELTDSALVYYDRALAMNPENYMAMNNLAYMIANKELGDLDRAERLSGLAIAAEPENAVYLDTYAWVLFKRGEYAQAKAYIDKALEYLDQDDDGDGGGDSDTAFDASALEYLNHAGDIYFFNGDPDMARFFWGEALKHDPDNDLLKRKVKHGTFFYK